MEALAGELAGGVEADLAAAILVLALVQGHVEHHRLGHVLDGQLAGADRGLAREQRERGLGDDQVEQRLLRADCAAPSPSRRLRPAARACRPPFS